ncbi:MAG TPA: hypothetical protein VJC21_03740 [Candidatus Nanoarchaeia archaeon]|nr:hypothetical protein [Candidatus Nanoarchaeia archaeon]
MQQKRGCSASGAYWGSEAYNRTVFFPSRKGQVTVFIIVGILILFAFAALLFLAKTIVKEPLSTAKEPVLEDVPQEFQPLQTYTVNCLQQVGEQGVRLLGEQGGYIDPALAGEFSAFDPTDADGITLASHAVPYWQYNANPNSENAIAFASKKPELFASKDPDDALEAQLARFIDGKLAGCLEDYQPFREQGFAITVDELDKKTEVVILDTVVDVFLDMEVKASRGDAQITLRRFFVRLPVPLKQYYGLAESIVAAEQQFSFLERHVLELIQIYSGLNSEKLPPTSALSFDLGDRTVWTEQNVQEQLRSVLNSYVPMLRFLESENFVRSEFPTADLSYLHQRLYDNMILPFPVEPKVSIDMDYFDWAPYFSVNSDNGFIQPVPLETHFNVLNFFMDTYNVVYDLSFPVLITLRDEKAFNGEGYSFTFALEANIRNNEPVRPESIIAPPITPREQSIICDKQHWDTEPIRALVLDSFTRQPLEAVQVGFSIPDTDFCTIGETNAVGVLESSYPAVYGGVGSFIKTDYLTAFYPIDTYRYKEEPGVFGYAVLGMAEPAVELHKIRNIPVTVKKKLLEKCVGDTCFFSGIFPTTGLEVFSYTPTELDEKHRWRFTGITQQLEPTETATITLRKVADFNPRLRMDDFTTAVTVSGNEPQILRLVPGIYEVQGLIVDGREVVIPKEERCYDILPLGIWEECYTLNKVSMDSVMQGQASWNTESTYVTITPEDLYSASGIEFYLPSAEFLHVPPQEHVRVIEDLQLMGEMERISQIPEVRRSLSPQFR